MQQENIDNINHLNNNAEDERLQALKNWLNSTKTTEKLGLDLSSIAPASNDASFRRYFRVHAQINNKPNSYILMDAPPPMEDIKPFLKVANLFAKQKINVPEIFAFDETQGFILLADMGNTTYMRVLNNDNPETSYKLYQAAIDRLICLQSNLSDQDLADLMPYDAQKLTDEMQLFIDWYLIKHLNYQPTEQEITDLHSMFKTIVDNNLSQTKTWVHRDYHCRNLMYIEDDAQNNPGILDFQDALSGSVTYDLVSLLRDAYIKWPEEFQLDCLIYYWQTAKKLDCKRLQTLPNFDQFYIDFEYMGLQRHLKVLGIFARLYHRDGKAAYLNDLPVVLEYTIATIKRYGDFAPLHRLFKKLNIII